MKRIFFLFSCLLFPFYHFSQAQERPLMRHEMEMTGRDPAGPNERFLLPHERHRLGEGVMQQNLEVERYHSLAPQAISSEPDQHPQHISSSSETVLEAWVARYNGPGNFNDNARVIAIDASGNVYVAGWSHGSGTFLDYATIKYDTSGTEQWVARYNGPGNDDDYARALAIDTNGNVYVAGYGYGELGALHDYATIKYDASGTEQWVARYNGPGNSTEITNALAIDASGNVYVTGYSEGSGTSFDYATIKYDGSGVEQWVARYNGPGNDNDYAFALAIDANGNVYVTGYSYWGSGTLYDYATIKYDASGTEQWVAPYNGPGNNVDEATDLAVDASGNVYVTGGSEGSASEDYATIKYDASGVEQWVARYDGPGNSWDYPRALAIDASGNVYVTGSSDGSGNLEYDYATLKYVQAGSIPIPCAEVDFFGAKCNANGAAQAMVKLLNSTEYAGDTVELQLDSTIYSVELITNGIHTIGKLVVRPAGYGQHTITLVNPGGCYDPITFNCQVEGAIADPEFDAAWAEFDALEASVAESLPEKTRLLGNYPNPFNPSTTLRYTLAEPGEVSLKIYNMLGQLVKTVVNEHQVEGYYEVVWDGRNEVGATVSSGIYVYRMTAGSLVETKRMLLVK